MTPPVTWEPYVAEDIFAEEEGGSSQECMVLMSPIFAATGTKRQWVPQDGSMSRESSITLVAADVCLRLHSPAPTQS